MDFEQFWTAFNPDSIYQNRYEATRKAWEQCPPEKQKAIMKWLTTHGAYKGRNPYFFVQDFQVAPEEPTNWNGKTLRPDVEYVIAKYNVETVWAGVQRQFPQERICLHCRLLGVYLAKNSKIPNECVRDGKFKPEDANTLLL